MVISDALAIGVGKILGKNLPEQTVKVGAGMIFFVFGALTMYEGGKGFSPVVWASAGAVIVLMGVLFLRHRQSQV